jgi:NADH-quinone oxidoreductase subunit M
MFKVHPAYTILGAIGIILGAWYLLLMVQKVLFGPVREPTAAEGYVEDANTRELAALIPIAVVCVWFGVYPKPLLDVLRPDVDAVAKIYAAKPGETSK